MPRVRDSDDDEPDDGDDAEFDEPLEADRDLSDSDDETLTVRCPHCGAWIAELAEYCPRCETYLSLEEPATSKFPLWVGLLLILTLFAVILSALR